VIGKNRFVRVMSLLPGGTTEWEDIQVRLGNFAPRERSPTREETENQLLNAAEEVDVLAKSSIPTLDRLIEHDGGAEDDLRDIERIRNARLEELQRRQASLTFGRVFPDVNKQNFIHQVTNASQSVPVLCLMFSHRSAFCSEMLRIFDFLAAKYKSIKFVSGVASEILATDFPDSKLPYIVLYQHGQCTQQLARPRPEAVASLVASLQCHGSDDEEISDLSREVLAKADREKDDDREYSSLFFNRHVLRR
jgi:hypothetical protein